MESKKLAKINVEAAKLLLNKDDPYDVAVSAIIFDICDRSGFKHLWHEIGEELREEIREVWLECVKQAIPHNRARAWSCTNANVMSTHRRESMKNQHLLDHIKKYNEAHVYRCETPADYLETLRECGEEVYRNAVNERRWWKDIFCVTELEGEEIGYMDAETTGDSSPYEIGWKFELSSICEVDRHERTEVIVTYTKRTS